MAKANRFISDDKAQMGNVGIQAVMALIVIGVMIYVGLQIMEGVVDSSALESGDTFYNTSQTVTEGVEASFSLTGVLMLVIIAAAIIAILMMFAMGSRQ